MKNLKHLLVQTEDELPRAVSACSDKTESIRSQIKKMGPLCKSRKKVIHVSPDDGFDEQVLGINGSFLSAADETMWLSSGCISPSSFFEEHEADEIPESNLFLQQASEAENIEELGVCEPLFWPFEWDIDWNFEAKSIISANINIKDEIPESNLPLKQASEAENIEDFNADEPLFWPFDRKIDWKSEETWKHFTMSPRKDIIKVTIPEETFNRSIGSELNSMNKNLQNKFSKKLLELKQGSKGYYNNNGGCKIKKGNTMPSRLRESTQVSAEMVPLNIENQILPLKVATMEDDFTSNEEVPIETVVGLGEFDGHEGIDSEFNEGLFLLDEAL